VQIAPAACKSFGRRANRSGSLQIIRATCKSFRQPANRSGDVQIVRTAGQSLARSANHSINQPKEANMSTDKTCSNCGAALMPGDIFCGECGIRVQALDYDVAAPNAPLNAPLSVSAQELPVEEETIAPPRPMLGDDAPPFAAPSKTGSENVGRAIVIIVAVVLLLSALCLCSLGSLVLVPTETETLGENLGPASLCCIPGIISGLLGAGAAYFGLRKPQSP